MATKRTFLPSARAVDPLSWFTGPLVPVAFSVLALIYGVILAFVTWGATPLPWLQLIAAALCTSTGIAVHFATRPLRRDLGWILGALTLVPVVAGMVVSAAGYAGSGLPVEQWWAPGALGLMIATLGPYVPVRQIVGLGGGATLVAVLVSRAIVHPRQDQWGPLSVAVIVAYPPVLSIIATSVFSYAVVKTMVRMLESPSRLMVPGQALRDEAAEHIERVTIVKLTARAVPFLEGIAAAGRITPADRALAGQLARRLRDELVTQSNLTWLDSIASESRLVVVDPDRLAHRMSSAQRTAMRGMLRAIVDTPGIDSGSLLVELRKAPDGSTAVAVSLDMALPEGRRIMHLAPYYLTLRTAVDDLVIDRETLLKLSFTVPQND
ncbi:MAG: hypothetical protein KKH51_12290 [Actinobacteria bacterium]|nr:hypothetical protein [Actinomycetota bacterium]